MYLFNLRWRKPPKARHFYVSQSDAVTAVTETGINDGSGVGIRLMVQFCTFN